MGTQHHNKYSVLMALLLCLVGACSGGSGGGGASDAGSGASGDAGTVAALSLELSALSVATETTCGGSSQITLALRDQNGSAYIQGGQEVAFSLSGGSSQASLSAVTDNGDGSYTARIYGNRPGSALTVNATVNGQAVAASGSSAVVFGAACVGSLGAWYKADTGVSTSGATVTSWEDQSGNGNTASSTGCVAAPTLSTQTFSTGGRDVVHFTRASRTCLRAADHATLSPTAGISIFVVAQSTTTATYQTLLIKTSAGTWTDGWGLYRGTTGTQASFFINHYSSNVAQGAMSANQFHLITANYDSAASAPQLGLFLEGSGTALGSDTYNAAINYPASYLRIGDDPDNNGTGGFDGDVAEILIYRGALSSSDRDVVRSYLNGKYGLY